MASTNVRVLPGTGMADKLYYGWLLAYLSTSPNFGAGLVLKKLGPHTNLKTDIECLCSTIVYFTSHAFIELS